MWFSISFADCYGKKYLKNGLPARQRLREFPWLPGSAKSSASYSLGGIDSMNTFFSCCSDRRSWFSPEFLRCFAHRTLCDTPMGKLRQGGGQIRGKRWK